MKYDRNLANDAKEYIAARCFRSGESTPELQGVRALGPDRIIDFASKPTLELVIYAMSYRCV
jgi:hypothetical protein